MDEKSRARDNMERGESNVREEERGDASDGRAGTSVGPIVMGDSAIVPEVRLWFIRLDTVYPWLPLVLDWEAGELGRYAAMLVPHQFSPTEGIRYNPEGLEIFMMAKIFAIAAWQKSQGISNYTRLKFMTQMLGYEIDDGLFGLLG